MVRRRAMKMIKGTAVKHSLGDNIFSVIVYTILILFAICALYPFAHVIAVSLSNEAYVARGAIGVIPKGLNMQAYIEVFNNDRILTGYKNTIYVTVLNVVLGVIVTAMTAYPLSKKKIPGKTALTIFICITMWFQAGMIPQFLVMKQLGLLNNLNGLVLAQLTTGYNVIVMKNFFSGIPESLEESAKLDGANDMQVLFKIVAPLSKPILSTVALWLAVSSWNNFFMPMLYLRDTERYTLQIFLREIVLNASVNYEETGTGMTDMIRYATIMVATVPILMVYPFIQKYFVQGTMVGAVKE